MFVKTTALLGRRGGPLTRLLRQTSDLTHLLEVVRSALPGNLRPLCVAAGLRGDCLILHLNSSAAAAQVRFLAKPILQTVASQRNLRLSSLKVKLAPKRDANPKTPPRRAHMSAANARLLRESADHVEDPKLGEALRRLARHAE